MNQYYIYRAGRSLSPAEQRAADQSIGELAAALAGARSTLVHGLGRGFAALKALGRGNRTRKEASVATTVVATTVAGH
jgi:hypothetical protein